MKYIYPIYFCVAAVEAASNLSRYDGIKYGNQFKHKEFEGDYKAYVKKIRSDYFGNNVKKRILVGNFLLSSRFEDFNSKISDSQKLRRRAVEEYSALFQKSGIDFIMSP